MATEKRTLSLTRPNEPQRLYGATSPQFSAGLTLAAVGLMLVMAFFIISAIVSGWVSDQDPTQLARIVTYNAWLLPASIASIALIKVGIAVVLWGIVRRLWIRVEGVKESLPALANRSGSSPS